MKIWNYKDNRVVLVVKLVHVNEDENPFTLKCFRSILKCSLMVELIMLSMSLRITCIDEPSFVLKFAPYIGHLRE